MAVVVVAISFVVVGLLCLCLALVRVDTFCFFFCCGCFGLSCLATGLLVLSSSFCSSVGFLSQEKHQNYCSVRMSDQNISHVYFSPVGL